MKKLIGLGILLVIGCGKSSTYSYIPTSPSCTVLQSPTGAILSCPDGTAVNIASGTAIQVVPLCPGTTTYPSNFIEVGFCINNNLYAVYSANNGFLTQIVPGNYSSNAIGNTCSLTVAPNCVVTH